MISFICQAPASGLNSIHIETVDTLDQLPSEIMEDLCTRINVPKDKEVLELQSLGNKGGGEVLRQFYDPGVGGPNRPTHPRIIKLSGDCNAMWIVCTSVRWFLFVDVITHPHQTRSLFF